jgi:DNA-binding PadR family transcriptional regulator
VPEQNEITREPNAMEFFLLALIERGGLKSFYALQSQAGLQPGGIRPSLDRLEAEGLLSRGAPSSRRKREYALTEFGRQFLAQRWVFSLQSYVELDSMLRAITVALLMGDRKTARHYLRDACADRDRAAAEKEVEITKYAGKSDPLSIYMWMRAVCETRRRRAEVEALGQIGEEIQKEKGNV